MKTLSTEQSQRLRDPCLSNNPIPIVAPSMSVGGAMQLPTHTLSPVIHCYFQ